MEITHKKTEQIQRPRELKICTITSTVLLPDNLQLLRLEFNMTSVTLSLCVIVNLVTSYHRDFFNLLAQQFYSYHTVDLKPSFF